MDRVVLVTKPTQLDELILLHNTFGAAQFILEAKNQYIDSYEEEDDAYKRAISEIRSQIPNDLPIASVSREDLPNFLFRESDLIIVCGPDGLFANLAKYVGNQPILTVNPNPKSIAGILMKFPPHDVGRNIKLVLDGKHKTENLPLAKASIDNIQTVWGINDIFIGRKDQISARYQIDFNNQSEHQSSSGIIVSTGIGSTGWICALAKMVTGLSDDNNHQLSILPKPTSDELVFAVREPFPSINTQTNLITGRISPGKPLSITSEMPTGGFIFSDGLIEKAVKWEVGSTVIVSIGDRYVQRII